MMNYATSLINNPRVAIAIADSHQDIANPKRGFQMYGVASQITGVLDVSRALQLWKTHLHVTDPKFSYETVKNRMFKVVPKRIKLFDEELFPVKDGKEPIMEF